MGTRSKKLKKKSRKGFFIKNRRSKSKYKKLKYFRKKTKKRGRKMTGGDHDKDCCNSCGKGNIIDDDKHFCNHQCSSNPCGH